MQKIKTVFVSLRPNNWIKNIFLFAPLIFSGKFLELISFSREVLAFIAFCLCSSAVYLLNDILDFDADKLHPVKSKRPIASGELTKRFALFLSLMILSVAFFISSLISVWLCFVVSIYYLLNLFYSLYLKKIEIIDVMTIAFDFELRIWAGSLAIGVIPSVWLQLMTFLLALFLGFTKRRKEIILLGGVAEEHRQVLSMYKVPLLDQFITLCAGLSILAYALYTVSPEIECRGQAKYLIYTLPFVIYGVLRYLYLVWSGKENGDPAEVLLSDVWLLSSVILWGLVVFLILYK